MNLKAGITLISSHFVAPLRSVLKWGEHWLSLVQTMTSLFPSLGCLLKETPIREASISEVRLKGHTQVRLLFMSAKPIKTLQPPTRPAF